MIKKYKVKNFTKIFFLIFFLLGIIMAPFALAEKSFLLFILSNFFGLSCLFFAIHLHFFRVSLTSDRVIQDYQYPKRRYELRLEEIEQIVDDDISLLGLKKLHAYHLMPKRGVKKSFQRFTIHEGIKDREDLLSEIVSRVPKDVQIEQSILNLVKEYRKTKESKC